METMHYSEKKKSSKGIVISFFLFVIIGVAIICFGISTEEEPTVIGKQESDIQRLVDLEKEDEKITTEENASIVYEVKDVKYSDSSNSKIKSEMTLPKILVESEELADINSKIDAEYNEIFTKLKEQMASAESKYTYVVSYNTYENMVDTEKIVSITIYQRVKDDSANKNTMDKIETYNIDLSTKENVSQFEIAQLLLGKDYKSIIKSAVEDYVVNEGMMKESEFTYAITGLEPFYVKDGVFHIIFNAEELVDSKYGVLDIEVKL